MISKTLSLKILKENMNEVFVETGTHTGGGTLLAIESGFKEIYSIELSDKFYKYAKKNFSQYDFVYIIHGESEKILYDVIKNINKPITFWLDAHYSGGDTAMGNKWYPICDELKQIKKHKNIKNHTILIDDINMFDSDVLASVWKPGDIENMMEQLNKRKEILPKIEDIKDIILSINKKYKIKYIDGYYKNSILVAKEN